MKDNRSQPRKPAAITATFTFRGKRCRGAVEDLSHGGLFIRTSESLPVGERIVVELSYLTLSEPFAVEAVVVGTRKRGVGVKFERLTPRQGELLGFLFW